MFKGAIASAAGVALLLGGAGTFALWQDTIDFRDNATINAGALHFSEDALPYATWKINGVPIVDLDDPPDGATDEIEAVRFVPGDVVTMTWDSVELVVDGDYLVAQFGVSLDDLDLTGLAQAEREKAEAFFADLTHEVEISQDGIEWHPTSATFPVERGVQQFHVRAKVTFDPEAMDQVAYGAAIPLQGLGLSVTQVPHALHPAG
jgi:alternate signal-mediated exported protein